MKPRLLIVGAGGHGRVVADIAVATGRWGNIAFADDCYPAQSKLQNIPILTTVDLAQSLFPRFSNVIVAIGDNKVRLRLSERFEKQGFSLVTIVHPSAVVASDVQLGKGTVIFANAVVNVGANVGNACIVNTGATVDHDCILDDGVHISPGSSLGGHVKVGKCSWFGIGSCAIQQVSVGEHTVIGAGAAVVSDIGSNVTAVGVPAKQLKMKNELC